MYSLFFCLFICLLCPLSVCLFVRLFVCLFVCLFAFSSRTSFSKIEIEIWAPGRNLYENHWGTIERENDRGRVEGRGCKVAYLCMQCILLLAFVACLVVYALHFFCSYLKYRQERLSGSLNIWNVRGQGRWVRGLQHCNICIAILNHILNCQ